MGQLLNEVKSTNDRGLIGITESGEEVRLSAPMPKAAITNGDESHIKKEIIKRHRKFYIQVGKTNYIPQGIGIAYNIYTKRR